MSKRKLIDVTEPEESIMLGARWFEFGEYHQKRGPLMHPSEPVIWSLFGTFQTRCLAGHHHEDSKMCSTGASALNTPTRCCGCDTHLTTSYTGVLSINTSHVLIPVHVLSTAGPVTVQCRCNNKSVVRTAYRYLYCTYLYKYR